MITHIGKPLKESRKCGCRFVEQPKGIHLGRGAWILRYEVTPCKKHSPAKEAK